MIDSRGQALIGAMAAALATSVVGTAVASNYASILKQSRRAYVQAAMNNLDSRVRYMATQPYAYTCGSDLGPTKSALDGIQSCQVNPTYFEDVRRVPMAGAECPKGTPPNTCGFTVSTPVLKPITSGGTTQMAFSYRLHYEGTDFQFKDLGYEPTALDGIPIPNEILQSSLFNCSTINPKRPIFVGFTAQGKPDCRAYDVCPVGQHVTAVTTGSLGLKCKAPTNTTLDCSGPDQKKIASVTWAEGAVGGTCALLPEAKFTDETYTNPDPTCLATQVLKDGVCVAKPTSCDDLTFTVNQTATANWSGDYDTPFQAILMVDLGSRLSLIPPECKPVSYDSSFGFQSGMNWLPRCVSMATVRGALPGSVNMAPQSCTRCGGNGSKYHQGFMNVAADQSSLAFVNYANHWGDGGGNPSAAAICNPTITIHTAPK